MSVLARVVVMTNLTDKTAIVIGVAPGNIGEAIAQKFVELGANVVIAGRSAEAIEKSGRNLVVAARTCDITREEDLERLAAFAKAHHGDVNVAVNAVGMNLVRPLLDVTLSELQAVVEAQFIGPFLFLQAMIRVMSRGGSIIQISSVTSQTVLPDHAAYMATKAAGDMLVRSAAFDFGCRGIRINSLSPGATLDSPMARDFMEDAAQREIIRRLVPLQRIGTRQDVANAAAWLASDECFMTGENIQINGGAGIPSFHMAGRD